MESWDYIEYNFFYSCIKDCGLSLLMLDNNELFLRVEELYNQTYACNYKNAIVMEGCFEPLIHTQINVVRSVVYNYG